MSFFRKQAQPAQPVYTYAAQPVYKAHFFYHGGGESAPVLHKQSGVQMTAQGHPDQVIPFLNRTQPALDAQYGWPMGEYDYAILIDPPHVAYPH